MVLGGFRSFHVLVTTMFSHTSPSKKVSAISMWLGFYFTTS